MGESIGVEWIHLPFYEAIRSGRGGQGGEVGVPTSRDLFEKCEGTVHACQDYLNHREAMDKFLFNEKIIFSTCIYSKNVIRFFNTRNMLLVLSSPVALAQLPNFQRNVMEE